ncbi:MAG: biliverdin-producing heme oxygenase [Ilumatobacter sp.]|nr:biliverdin-producing heme oxygenase [Ilumatobacter sp.]
MADGGIHAADPIHVLRRGVADLHDRVDRLSGFGAPSISSDAYRSLVAALASVVPAVEAAVIGSDDALVADVPPFAPLLLDDARRLGITPQPWAVTLDDAAQRWGARYVLAGSQLGAVVIARRLRDELPELPRAYFTAAATGAGERWAAFRSDARVAFADDELDVSAAVDAARDVFERLLAVLERSVCDPSTVGAGGGR